MTADFDQRWQEITGDVYNAGRDINITINIPAASPPVSKEPPKEEVVGCQSSEHLVFPGSPFLPRLPKGFLDEVKLQINRDQKPPQLIIAKDLLTVISSHYAQLIQPQQMIMLYNQFGARGNDLFYYLLGFIAPLTLICTAFFAELQSDDVARQYLSRLPISNNDREVRMLKGYLQSNWEHCHSLLLDDNTCSDIFEYTLSHPFKPQTFYCAGVEGARVSFFVLNVEILKWIGFSE